MRGKKGWMHLPRHVFREYDIRGVADRDLTDGFVRDVARAYAEEIQAPLGRPARIAVGRDGRLSGPRIWQAFTSGVLDAGASVIDVGVGPTPLLYFAAHHLETDGAVHVTGSHNPAEDNGLKMMRGKGSFFGADIQRLRTRIERGELPEPGRAGVRSAADVSDAYVDAVVQATRAGAGAAPRVVLDAGNGAAGPLGVRVLGALGFDVDPLFCDIDGRFPNHHPDPTVPKNLEALRARVLETGAALGVAFDGDGDRIGAVDERGDIVWGDKLMILFARAVLAEHPGATILGEVKCSETLFADVRARGGRALYSKTGHSLIKTRMKEEGALLAGEMSGHIFFADRYFGFDDAIYAAARLVEILAREGKPLSALLADVPPTFATPEIRVSSSDEAKFGVVDSVLRHYKATHAVLDLDGARVDFGDGAWGLCRASNTQPVLVLRFEAKTPERLAEIRRDVEAVVTRAGGRLDEASHA
jgi:phosphomannomutase/phosphoglucomutase